MKTHLFNLGFFKLVKLIYKNPKHNHKGCEQGKQAKKIQGFSTHCVSFSLFKVLKISKAKRELAQSKSTAAQERRRILAGLRTSKFTKPYAITASKAVQKILKKAFSVLSFSFKYSLIQSIIPNLRQRRANDR